MTTVKSCFLVILTCLCGVGLSAIAYAQPRAATNDANTKTKQTPVKDNQSASIDATKNTTSAAQSPSKKRQRAKNDQSSQPQKTSTVEEVEPLVAEQDKKSATPAAKNHQTQQRKPKRAVADILLTRQHRGVAGAPGFIGFSGLGRVITADPMSRYSVHFGSRLGLYLLKKYWNDARQEHLDAFGYFSFAPHPNLELRIAGSGLAHKSGMIAQYRQDVFYQAFGDILIGTRYAKHIKRFASMGGAIDLNLPTRINDFSVTPQAIGFSAYVFTTLDFSNPEWVKRKAPVRLHATLGYHFDRSSALMNELNVQTASTFSGFGLQAGDRLLWALGVEFLFDNINAFIEYSAEPVVIKRTNLIAKTSYLTSPNRLTLGARFNLLGGLLLDVATDLSFGLQKEHFFDGKSEPVDPPYKVYVGVGYGWRPGGWKIVDRRGRVSGVVLDAQTGKPLDDAIIEYLDTVDYYSPQAVNPFNGAFTSDKLPPGDLALRVEQAGYEPALVRTEIIPKSTIEQKILLKPIEGSSDLAGVLTGIVLNENKEILSADIQFVGSELSAIRSSQQDGQFFKTLPQGNYKVRVEAKGHEPKDYDVRIEREQTTKINFILKELDQLGVLAGAVKNTDGFPIIATVRFVNNAELASLKTDGEGRFALSVVPGDYAIQVEADGYRPQQYQVPVKKAQRTQVEISLIKTLNQGVLYGKVINNKGRPLPGFAFFDKEQVAPIPADPDTGVFEVRLESGTYTLTVKAPGYQTRTFQVPVIKDKKITQDFILETLAELKMVEGVTVQEPFLLVQNPIVFEPGTTMLVESAFTGLDLIARFVNAQNRPIVLNVKVHTHDLGPTDVNLRLSQARAEVIKEYLQKAGVANERIKAQGFGEEQPLKNEQTTEARNLNERVEFFFE